MTIILDQYAIPERGKFNLDLHLSIDLNVTAQEAKRLLGRWARREITMLLRAKRPMLVLSQQRVWRVPLEITFPVLNGAFDVCSVDVDVQTGKIVAPAVTRKKIHTQLETKVRPFAPVKVTPFVQ